MAPAATTNAQQQMHNKDDDNSATKMVATLGQWQIMTTTMLVQQWQQLQQHKNVNKLNPSNTKEIILNKAVC
jgi:hypothetical protein